MSVVLEPGEGTKLSVLGLQFTAKVGSSDARGAFCLNEVGVVPEAPPLPLHTHANEEESIYVLEGELNIELGDRTVKCSSGSLVLVPRGTAHTLSLAGTQSAKVLLIFSPAAIQGLFEEIAGQTDMDTIVAAAGRYGMEIVG